MKNFVLRVILFFATSVLMSTYAVAYEVNTHEEITKYAFDNSVLGSGNLDDRGISISKKLITDRLIEGSKKEDETIPSDFGGAWARYRHHYFDPIYNRGLVFWTGNGYKAPDWALEDTATYSGQFYSIQDAKQYYLTGLTAADKTERGNNLAKTFRTLGQVLHTIQDMAQPQHTRNDAHGGFFGYDFGPQIFGPKSQYEIWASDKVGSLKYNPPYPDPVVFNSYRQFYITGSGKGMAEFSNRNFVTEGTNIDCGNNIIDCNGATGGGYPSPVLNISLQTDELIENLLGNNNPQGLTGFVTFFGNKVTDHYSGETFTNHRMTTYSIFDRDLQKKGKSPAFTLNNFNFKAMADILLPRAVGYSAGLLNYFFRGKIDMIKDPNNSSQYIIKNESNEKMEGIFSLYYDDASENRNAVPGASWTFSGDKAIGQGGKSEPVTFTAPTDAKEKGKYILVFQGTLGNEQGAVVGRVVTLDSGIWEDWEKGIYTMIGQYVAINNSVFEEFTLETDKHKWDGLVYYEPPSGPGIRVDEGLLKIDSSAGSVFTYLTIRLSGDKGNDRMIPVSGCKIKMNIPYAQISGRHSLFRIQLFVTNGSASVYFTYVIANNSWVPYIFVGSGKIERDIEGDFRTVLNEAYVGDIKNWYIDRIIIIANGYGQKSIAVDYIDFVCDKQ